MERQLLRMIVSITREIVQRGRSRFRYDDVEIVRVYYWSVLWDRAVSWACRAENWPSYERRRKLPSQSTMSRRLRLPRLRGLLDEVERRVVRSAETGGGWVWFIDGKPLPIGGCSKDRQAGYGRAASGMPKGYKLHAVVGMQGVPVSWRVAPMNQDERVIGARLLRDVAVQGYVLGDGHYDSNPLHDVCLAHGNFATGYAAAVPSTPRAWASSSQPGSTPQLGPLGRSRLVVRSQPTRRTRSHRTLLRPPHRLRRRTYASAPVRPYSPPSPPLGPSQNRPPNPPKTTTTSSNLRRLMHNLGK